MPSGFTSMSLGSIGARRILAASLGKDSVERPWKERVQSTWRAPSSSSTGWSEKPSVRSGRGSVGWGVGWRIEEVAALRWA